MKKLFCYFGLFWIAVSCSSNNLEPEPLPEVEAPCYKIYLQVFDAQTGKTLLDPRIYPSLFWLKDVGVTARCRGEIYELNRFDDPHYNPKSPFRLEQYIEDYGYRYRIVFDGFTMDKSFSEQLTIDWGIHGFNTEMVVTAQVERIGNELKIERSLTVDGEPIACEEGKDWVVRIDKEIYDNEYPDDYLGFGVDATGKWEITDLEASINEIPVSSHTPEEAIFWIHWLMESNTFEYLWDKVQIGVNVLLDTKKYSVLVPDITISRQSYEDRTFIFEQEVTTAEMTIDDVPQTIKKMKVRGSMSTEVKSTGRIAPYVVFAPQTNFYSDLEFYIECETCTLKLKMNYLRVIEDRG